MFFQRRKKIQTKIMLIAFLEKSQLQSILKMKLLKMDFIKLFGETDIESIIVPWLRYQQ